MVENPDFNDEYYLQPKQKMDAVEEIKKIDIVEFVVVYNAARPDAILDPRALFTTKNTFVLFLLSGKFAPFRRMQRWYDSCEIRTIIYWL